MIISSPSDKDRPLFTLRTSELAGRSKELSKLQKILRDLQQISTKTLCCYIAGDGGMGKTRMLEWVRARFQRPRKTLCTRVLDLSNSILRTDVDLVEQIFDDIEPDLKRKKLLKQFNRYVELRDRFRRQQLGAVGGDIRHQVMDAFVDAWKLLVQDGYRLVILLDTAELLRFEDDAVRERFQALLPAATTKQWLADIVRDDNKLPGVLFVVAGRKVEAKELHDELCELANYGVEQAGERIIDLAGLSRTGVQRYLAALARKLQEEGFAEQSHQLQNELDEQRVTAFYKITDGSPIALAIALQLYIDGDSPDLLELIDDQVNQKSSDKEQVQQRLQKALVKALAEYVTFAEMSIAIHYMALARKGLTPKRLRALLNEPSYIQSDTLFENLAGQIFVKRRPDGSLVLHDKIAEWVLDGLYRPHDKRSVEIYRKLTALYLQEIKETERAIESLNARVDLIVSQDGDEMERESIDATMSIADPVARENTLEFRQARRQRRNLVIDRMTYALRCDPIEGYKQYYDLAEEAFNVGRMDYESQIRSEFLDWWDGEATPGSKEYVNRTYAASHGLTEAIVNADFAIRAVQREYNGESPDVPLAVRFHRTLALVDRLHAAIAAGTLVVPDYTHTLLHIYQDTAAGQIVETEQEVERIRKDFGDNIHELTQPLAQEALQLRGGIQRFLVLSALAFAYYEHGFFESNHGNHGEAIRSYTLSLLPYRELGFEINQARSLNDKAYSLAVIGDSDNAETAIRDALDLRQKLGFSYLVGLSYNTFGIVQTMSERPLSAVRYCRYALRIFQGLSHEFGQMIAYRALSEAYRRNSERLPGERRRRLEILEKALAASQAAIAFARQFLGAHDALLVEVLDEAGCAQRDIANFCWRNPDLDEGKYPNAYMDAEALLKEAITIAIARASTRGHLVDSTINLAYLRYYRVSAKDTDKVAALQAAATTLQQALDQIPTVYRDLHHPEHLTVTRQLNVYWTHLAKASSLHVWMLSYRLRLLADLTSTFAEQRTIEDELLVQSTYTLYFCSLLQGNVRNVRRSQAKVYDAFRVFSVQTLERFYQAAIPVATTLGIPPSKQGIMKEYLAGNFGLI